MISPNSLAAAVAAGVKNVQFQSIAEVLKRRIAIVATYDPALTGVIPEVPVLVTSPEDTGDKFGFGFMAHRLAKKTDIGAGGIETYIIPQAEPGGGTQAAGTITFTITTVVAGTVFLYIAGDLVAVNIPAEISGVATDEDDIAGLVIAAINADADLPVTALVDGVNANEIDVTAKTSGTYGNEIDISVNLDFGQELPGGVTAVIVPMATGVGTPTMQDALENGLGTGDTANSLGITDLVHGYLQDSGTLNAISAYVGEGDNFTGLYAKLVGRPFRALTGDTAPGSGALTALISLSDGRKLDRSQGIIAVPDSQSHPSEIAAQAIGVMARVNNNLAEESTIDQALFGIWPGDNANQWTSDFDNRDTAVNKGIGTTLLKNGVITIQNLVSFYRPASIPVSSNGYRSLRNISILQNILVSHKTNFEQDKWKGISIVADTNRVIGASSKKARDTNSVIDDLQSLSKNWEKNAWLFSADFTIEGLRQPGAVVLRAGNTGFDSTLQIILSGEGGILNTTVEFDISAAVLLG